MKTRRVHTSDAVFRLDGGTEDNDLWVTTYPADEQSGPALGSVWVPSDEERQAIADGANIELLVWGTQHPPVAVRTTATPIGKRPDPYVLVDNPDDGVPDERAWVARTAASTPEEAILVLTTAAPAADDLLEYRCADETVWMRRQGDHPGVTPDPHWYPCEANDDGAVEFWRVEVVDREIAGGADA